MDRVVILKTDPEDSTVHQAIIPYGQTADGKEICRVVDTKTGAIITTRERNSREEAVAKAYHAKKEFLVHYYSDGEVFELKRPLSSSEKEALEKMKAVGRKKVVILVSNKRLDDTRFSPSAPAAAASGWGRFRFLQRTPPLAWEG